ncbi:MAG TPA: mechanosensitive ion channel family protein, partial [Desulfosporosinus sp.]|nr:mechanosensitive ion channel family protein [Desulfosporosinus sp.]
MIESIMNWMIGFGINESMARYLSTGILVIFIVLLSIVAYFISKEVVLRSLSHFIQNTQCQWDNVLLERRVFHKLS